jgi:hypothetical protein
MLNGGHLRPRPRWSSGASTRSAWSSLVRDSGEAVCGGKRVGPRTSSGVPPASRFAAWRARRDHQTTAYPVGAHSDNVAAADSASGSAATGTCQRAIRSCERLGPIPNPSSCRKVTARTTPSPPRQRPGPFLRRVRAQGRLRSPSRSRGPHRHSQPNNPPAWAQSSKRVCCSAALRLNNQVNSLALGTDGAWP